MSRSSRILLILALLAVLWTTVPASHAHHGGHGGFHGYGHGGYHGYNHHHYGYYPGIGIGIGIYPGYYPAYVPVAPAPVVLTPEPVVAIPAAPAVAVPLPPDDPPAASQLATRPNLDAPPPVRVASNKARIRVLIPADAMLWFDGEITVPTGPEREFLTPELPTDRPYTYQLKAKWAQGGQPVERTLDIKVRRNETTTADFSSLPAPKE
jgi:uncharacterized protein (TIGR03000 family)